MNGTTGLAGQTPYQKHETRESDIRTQEPHETRSCDPSPILSVLWIGCHGTGCPVKSGWLPRQPSTEERAELRLCLLAYGYSSFPSAWGISSPEALQNQ